MGLFDMFGGSFEKKVQEAVAEVEAMPIGVENLRAQVEGKTVTLHGTAVDMEAKRRVMAELDRRIEADNIINRVDLVQPPPAAAREPEPVPPEVVEEEERYHEVVGGDTLGALAKRYYGNANMYMRIFEANRDILDDPDLIRVGQKLRIPVIE